MDYSIWDDVRIRNHWDGLSDAERLAYLDADTELVAVPDRLPDCFGGADTLANSECIPQRDPKHKPNGDVNSKQQPLSNTVHEPHSDCVPNAIPVSSADVESIWF